MLSMSHASSPSKAMCKKQFKIQTSNSQCEKQVRKHQTCQILTNLPNQGHGEEKLSFKDFKVSCLFLNKFVLRKFYTGTQCLLPSLTPHPLPFPYHPNTPHSSPQISRAFVCTSFVLWHIVTNKGCLRIYGFEATHWSLVGSAVATPLPASMGRQNFSCKDKAL